MNNLKRIFSATLLLWLGVGIAGQSASFDCNKAASSENREISLFFIKYTPKFLSKKFLNIMREENQLINPKSKALNWIYATIYKEEIFPRSSFKKFKEENAFFLDGLTIKLQMREHDMYYFYFVCKKVKLPITRVEIREYFVSKE